ncbi:hypothetical protein AB1L42_04870 [Thalassoglobus sp. JC818]|uniref:tetratricopeptide repeat protein n=1 Tax=Thalassoglobus sp. JC818 TaxID=3232136 RepID=UPI00345A642A
MMLPRRCCILLIIVSLTLCLCTNTRLLAAEPVLEFVEGLRQRGYYDTALEYLTEIENRQNLPQNIVDVLAYERAETLLQNARRLKNLDDQRKQLDAAQASFEQFVKASPNHPLAGRANTARGRILLEKARVEIWDGDKPSNAGSRDLYRQNARDLIQQARGIFQQAVGQHEKAVKAFPTFIPPENKEMRAERAEAESQFMEAELDLTQCKYWEAQTYDRGSEQHKKILTEAAFEFEKIHERYRSQLGGLYARMWQGKCFEEQDEIGIALGIYEEILGHEGRSDAMRSLKDSALRFRLICLNHEQREDYKLVVLEAEEWLRDARTRSRTDVGLGIQWELCRALEVLGVDRTLSETERRNNLTEALNRARTIARFPGELKTPASAMIQRLMVALNRDPGDPKDFDTAYGNAGQIYEEVNSFNQAINQAKLDGNLAQAKEIQETLIATAGEMARLYDLAIRFVQADTDPIMVNIARLRLAYGYLLQQKYLDAGVVAQYQMDKYGDAFPEVGREAGFIAMTAFDYAYSDASPGNREFEAAMVKAMAEKLASRWPDSGRANDARNAVAKIAFQDGDLLGAAEWWDQVPQGSSDYANAQIRSGKAYWRQYDLEASKPALERPTPEQLNEWKAAAIQRLQTGIAEAEKNIPAEKPLPDEVVSAKLSLVSIRNMDGIYETPKDGPTGAIELLTVGPHSVIASVSVADGESRPTEPSSAKSREMASFAYQQLLRAYIGIKNLDEARNARMQLEQVAGSDDAAALTQIFVSFGRELEQELERLKASGENERVQEVREGFEGFLNDLSNRKEGQTFYSMLWIAETFASLGDASRDDQQKSEEYFTKSSDIYRQIVERAGSEPDFVSDPRQITSTKLRLVNTLRRKPEFPAAETVILEILQESPNAPDAQFEAASLYQDWGQQGGPDALEHFQMAIAGQKEPIRVWGWAYTAQALQRAIFGKDDPRMEQLHFDARYNLAETEFQYGMTALDNETSVEHLRRAQAAISGFQRVSNRWPDAEYQRFNKLYRQVLEALGSPVVDLPRDVDRPQTSPDNPVEQVAQQTDPTTATEDSAAATPESSSSPLLMILLLVVGGAAVAGLYFLAVGQNKRKYSKYQNSSGTPATKSPAPAESIQFDNVFEAPADVAPVINVPDQVTAVKAPPIVTKKSASATKSTADAPVKKKRKLTEEEVKKIKAARAAKAAKQKSASDGKSATGETPTKKRRPKPPSSE